MVDEAEYKRIAGLLLHLDFATLDKAVGSSRRWLNEVGMGDGGEADVIGRAVIPDLLRVNGAEPGTGSRNVINVSGLVRRKNASISSETDASRQPDLPAKEPAGLAAEPTTKVNVLGASLVRKRKKEVADR
jgi:regulator of Ty1 transposition protein 109